LYREALGNVLVEERRYTDAVASFEKGASAWPEWGGCHRGMAVALLQQSLQAADALAKSRRAVELDQIHSAAKVGVHDLDFTEPRTWNVARSVAVMAWAEAANAAESGNVEDRFANALALCSESVHPVRSEIYYYWGHAYLSLGNRDQGMAQF